MWNRNAFIIVSLSISFVFCLFTIVPLLAQENSWEAWLGVIIGSSMGIWSCLYLFRAIQKNKANNNEDSQSIKLTTNHKTSRWMIISAVGGIFLARLVSNSFNPSVQSLINNGVSAWIITLFSGAAILIRKYLPKDWESS